MPMPSTRSGWAHTRSLSFQPPTGFLRNAEEDRSLYRGRRQGHCSGPCALDRSRGQALPELTALSKRLFDTAKNTLVPDEAGLASALNKAAKPDFRLPADDARRAANSASSVASCPRPTSTSSSTPAINPSTRPPASPHPQVGRGVGSGQRHAAPARRSPPIHLEPYESRVFVFSDSASTAKPAPERPQVQLLNMSTAWKVTFPGHQEDSRRDPFSPTGSPIPPPCTTRAKPFIRAT